MCVVSFADEVVKKNITCCLSVKNDDELIVSIGVEKLNTIKSSVSP